MPHIQLHVVPITIPAQYHVLHSFLIGKLTPVMYVVYAFSFLRYHAQKKLSKLGQILQLDEEHVYFSSYLQFNEHTCSSIQLNSVKLKNSCCSLQHSACDFIHRFKDLYSFDTENKLFSALVLIKVTKIITERICELLLMITYRIVFILYHKLNTLPNHFFHLLLEYLNLIYASYN